MRNLTGLLFTLAIFGIDSLPVPSIIKIIVAMAVALLAVIAMKRFHGSPVR